MSGPPPPPSLASLRAAIPAQCFEKRTSLSLLYLARDLGLLATAVLVYPYVHGVLAHVAYWMVYGFIAWCLFVVGHDCGHGSFSPSPLLNGVCGLVSHSVLLVPFYPWAYTHSLHHCFHNCQEKDKSHPWYLRDEWNDAPLLFRTVIMSVFGPLVAFPTYLFLGYPDGSHLVWWGSLYAGRSAEEKAKCFLSTACVVGWAVCVYWYAGSFAAWWGMYGGVIAVCYVWLFAVTWFQHHDDDTLVYPYERWSFIKGAMETIDRTVGFGIDDLHHNITDGHFVHHLFFREIPHYNLKEATAAVHKALGPRRKQQDHSSYAGKYFVDFFRTYFRLGFVEWKWG